MADESNIHVPQRAEDRSFFWPIVLIGVGVIWLLANFNVIPGLSWGMLARLWPVLLIAAGLDLIFGRSHPALGAIVGLATVALVIALLVAGPQLGVPAAPVLRTERLTEPLGEASAATVNLDLQHYAVTVNALSDSASLVDANLTHAGEATLDASGDANKTVSLRYREVVFGPLVWFSGGDDARWTIGLSPRVSLTLNIDSGSGIAELDLTGLDLAALSIDGGSGSLQLTLPVTEQAFEAQLDGGSGSQQVQAPAELMGTLNYEGGSGSFAFETQTGAAMRVEVRESGSGSVRVPSDWDEISSGPEDEGVWQTPGFDQAERQFVLVIEDVGSGSVTVR